MYRVNRVSLLCAALVTLSLPLAAQAKSVLIIDNNNPVMGSPVVSAASLVLGDLEKQAGNTVTYSGLLLPTLSDFDQIWDIRFSTPISAPLQADYLSFLQTGGNLALIGENFIFKPRNDTIDDFLGLAGAGKVSETGPSDVQDVLAPFDGPFPVSKINFHGPGGFFEIGHGKGITTSYGGYGGMAFDPGTLDNAQLGRLVVFMDYALFTPEDDPLFPSPGAHNLTRNLIHYLGDEPGPLPGTRGGVPEPATWALMLTGMGVVGATVRRRRMILALGS